MLREGSIVAPHDARGFFLGGQAVNGSQRSGGRSTTAQLGVSKALSSVVCAASVVLNNDSDTGAIVVTALDAAGVAIANASVSLSATGSNNTFGATTGTTNSSGIFSTTLRSSTAETKTVTAIVGGLTLATSPMTFAAANVPSAADSTLSLSNASVVSAATRTLTVTAKSAGGGAISVGGATVVGTQTGGTGGTVTFGVPTDNNNGTYSIIVTGVLAGTRSIGATINGVAISTTNPTITVTPGALDRTASTLTLSASTVVVGSDVLATLHGRDAAGNLRSSGGGTIVISHSGGTSDVSDGAVTDVGDGTYTASMHGNTGGTATTMSATINGSAVTTTMPTLQVTAGFATPNILNRGQFAIPDLDGAGNAITIHATFPSPQNGWSGHFDGGSSKPNGIVRDSFLGYTWIKRTMNSGGEEGGWGYYGYGAEHDEVWMRWDFLYDVAYTGESHKLVQFYDGTGTITGGLYLEKGNSTRLCVYQALAGETGVGDGFCNVKTNVAALCGTSAGNIHSIEMHYNRVGDTYPYYEFWIDDVQVTTGTVQSPAFWSGGKLMVGGRANSRGVIAHYISGIKNGGAFTGTTPVLERIKNVSYSSAGRIGPG